MNETHIADIDFAEFFEAAFQGRSSADFIRCVERIPAADSKAKIVIHQSARMVWLGDRVSDVAFARPALEILFHLIAAEAVAKIVFDFEDEGQSRKYVRRFFEEICDPNQHRILLDLFSPEIGAPALSLREVIDLLYDVRCDVAHEGKYFLFSMPREGSPLPLITSIGDRTITVRRPVEDLRRVVLQGAVLGARRLLPVGSPCAGLL